jgi:ribose-phosphate pyrophosphokinase
VYTIPALTLTAAPRIAAWITRHVPRPVVIGPDAESAQWAEAVAAACRLPCVVLEKVRHGDRKVAISVPDLRCWRDHTPVLVDDIISTAGTMLATVRHLRRARLAPAVCIGVHAVFADGAYDELRGAGVARVVTCNTIAHPSNAIDVADVLADGVARALGSRQRQARATTR